MAADSETHLLTVSTSLAPLCINEFPSAIKRYLDFPSIPLSLQTEDS
jgi:hypothetical protein